MQRTYSKVRDSIRVGIKDVSNDDYENICGIANDRCRGAGAGYLSPHRFNITWEDSSENWSWNHSRSGTWRIIKLECVTVQIMGIQVRSEVRGRSSGKLTKPPIQYRHRHSTPEINAKKLTFQATCDHEHLPRNVARDGL